MKKIYIFLILGIIVLTGVIANQLETNIIRDEEPEEGKYFVSFERIDQRGNERYYEHEFDSLDEMESYCNYVNGKRDRINIQCGRIRTETDQLREEIEKLKNELNTLKNALK